MKTPQFIKASGIFLPRELETFKRKKGMYLQPIFEAVTNAWEAIMDKFGNDNLNKGEIIIRLYASKGLELDGQTDICISSITIEDNGIGLDEANLERLKNLRDPSKGHSNNGTGRIQYLYYFSSTIIESVTDVEGKSSRVKVTLSMNDLFLNNNSILRLDEMEDVENQPSRTVLSFIDPLNDKDAKCYGVLTASLLKTDIITHTLARLCDNRNCLPKITIERYLNQELDDSKSITDADILEVDKDENIDIQYATLIDKKIVKTNKKESFRIRSFVVPQEKLESNKLYLVSKGELGNTLPLDLLSDKESIDGKRYMFLLSGDYLDARDSDDRGNINLMKESELKKRATESTLTMFPEEEVILREDIVKEVNHKISGLYQVFKEKEQEKDDKIQELQEMFLLDADTVNAIRSKVKKNSTDADILKLVYDGETDKMANLDASIKQVVKGVQALNPKKPNYQDDLKKLVVEFSSKIPEQNKSALTKYIARRKLVLELFDKILKNEIDSLREGKRIDEDVLHNLIFKQHSNTAYSSDLWLLDDQYLYFSGCSERELNNIKINGKNLLKQELNFEEKAYKLRQERDVGDRRPDVMLFPEEGKCVIVEFKAPKVDVSAHLDQINRYAMIIHNLSDSSFEFNTFYGYLIGENVDYDAIQESNVYFKKAANLGYIFRPNYPLTGKFGHTEGDLYTEIIKYSDLLKRAQLRNRVFIDKLEEIV